MEDSIVKPRVSFTPKIVPFFTRDSQIYANFTPKKFPQFLATFASTLGSFGLGCVLAWTSPALPDLEKRQDFGTLSFTQTSWITSLAILGALLSGPCSGFLINWLGRRKTMLFMTIPFTIGWFCIGFAQWVPMIYIGRFITGFSGGSFTVTIPVYVSEFAENRLRGMLGSAMVLMLVSGILFDYTVGAFVSWSQLALVSSTAPILCFIGLLFTPESPRYLLAKEKTDEAVKSLKWFRGAKEFYEISPELSNLQRSIDFGSDNSGSNRSGWKCLLQPSVFKPLCLTLALMFFQQMSGVNAIQSYTVKIFQSVSPDIDPNLATITVGVIQVVFVFLSMMFVDRVGRKLLLSCSFLIMFASLSTLVIYILIKESIPQYFTWIPLVAVIFFVVAYSFGVGPLPWVLFGEIISPNAKGFASAIVTSFYWIIAFISTKTVEDLANLIGWFGYYSHLALICLVGAIFVVIMIPETKGKSAEEIQNIFVTKQPSLKDQHEGTGESEKLNTNSEIVDVDNNLSLGSKITSDV